MPELSTSKHTAEIWVEKTQKYNRKDCKTCNKEQSYQEKSMIEEYNGRNLESSCQLFGYVKSTVDYRISKNTGKDNTRLMTRPYIKWNQKKVGGNESDKGRWFIDHDRLRRITPDLASENSN